LGKKISNNKRSGLDICIIVHLQRDKKRKELDKQLEEANLERNATRVLRIRTDIITAIFTLYFIILKKAPDSMLMSSVLAGLAK